MPEWEAAARRWLEEGGAVMVLGAPDTGKSTLSRYLVYRAYAAGQPVGLVDLDLGQSHLGPPAALGLGLFPPLARGMTAFLPRAFISSARPRRWGPCWRWPWAAGGWRTRRSLTG